jgi:hypothetical protein
MNWPPNDIPVSPWLPLAVRISHPVTCSMNDPQFHQHGGPDAAARPRWKRMHHSPFFWIAAAFILLAMIVYVVTGDLSFRPGRAPKNQVPALAP